MKRFQIAMAGVLLLAGLVFAGNGLWMQTKAQLSQLLMQASWQYYLDSGDYIKPWPWADTWPVAKLVTPAGDALYVLHGVSGEALAFGPGWMPSSAEPGGLGTVAIAGHRDSHLAFVQDIERGDMLQLEVAKNERYYYRVAETRVVDSRKETPQFQFDVGELQLMTCYPFDAISSGGPLRFLVTAWRVDSPGGQHAERVAGL